MKPQAIICDIDGTLIHEDNKSYRYSDVIFQGKPIIPITKILQILGKSLEIIFITGRTENVRKDVIAWLEENVICPTSVMYPPIRLFMCKDGDYRKNYKIKKEIYENHIKDKYEIIAILCNAKQMKRTWIKEGLFVFDVGTDEEENI